MGRWRSAAAGLRLLCLLWHLVSSKNVQPRCLTDFATELVCRWEVGAITNCTMEFKLLYQANFATKPQECPLENERGPGTASLCICKIPGKKFKGVTYHLALARTENSAKVWSNLSLKMESIVKPRPLINLRVEKRNDRTFILTWKRDYSPSNTLHNPAAKYEVAYWRQNHTEEKIIVPEDSSHYTIFADNLQSHSTYEASVRYGLKLWGETWSEWSATCEWVNGECAEGHFCSGEAASHVPRRNKRQTFWLKRERLPDCLLHYNYSELCTHYRYFSSGFLGENL